MRARIEIFRDAAVKAGINERYTVPAPYGAMNNSMKATTCQMSNVCCAMSNELVKEPTDPMT